MKKSRIGIFGKTLAFTMALVLVIAGLIVWIFSSQFLKYAEETHQAERESRRTQLIASLQMQSAKETQEILEQYTGLHPEDSVLLIHSDDVSFAWCSENMAAELTEFQRMSSSNRKKLDSIENLLTPAENDYLQKCITISAPVAFYSFERSLDFLKKEIEALREQWAVSEKPLSAFLQEYVTAHPDMVCILLPSLQKTDETPDDSLFLDKPDIAAWIKQNLSFYPSRAENGIPETMTVLNGAIKYEPSGTEITLSDGVYPLVMQQSADNEEPLRSLASILLQVVGIALLPALAGSFLFAKWLTGPVKRLAAATGRMANREAVTLEKVGKDEIGDLTRDVHSLYEQLTATIQDREEEMRLISRLEENQRELFAAASHELKTPVAALSALLEGMLEEVGDYKDHPKYLKECMKTTDSMKRLIAELLEIVRLEEKESAADREPVSLSDWFAEKRSQYEAIAESNRQQLCIEVPDETICYADRSRLGRVLDNIIMNALQNTGKNKQIRIWSESGEDSLSLNIWNEDAHIPDDLLDQVFEPFFRVDQARSRKDKHSGLGLAITKRLLDSMEISFELKNTADGVLFRLDLPIK